jgi:putative tryptophan/tyrosine transport system substrate-binding protein
MRRRDFIQVVGGIAVGWPVAALGQPSHQARRVAVLMGVTDDDEGRARLSALQQTLRQLGWLEGQTIIFDVRWAAANISRARSLASELVNLKPDVIVANSAPALSAMRDTTSTIPIIFVQVNDPVKQGFVTSMSRPSGNITGFLNFEEAIAGKWIQLLKEIAPTMRHVATLFSSDTASRGSGGNVYLQLIRAKSLELSVDVLEIPVRTSGEIDSAIASVAREQSVAIVVLPDIFNTVNRSVIIASAAQHRIPAIYPYRYFAVSGGLISYGVETSDLYRRAAGYVDRILKGGKVIDLPVQAPTKFEMVINAKCAKALGLEVPLTLIARADEVIE